MKKLMALLLIAMFSVTAAFAADTTAVSATPVPAKAAQHKVHKHHVKKSKAPVVAETPAAK